MKLVKIIRIFFKGFKLKFLFLFFLGALTSFIGFVRPMVEANIITGITEEAILRVVILAGALFLIQLSNRILLFVTNTIFSKVRLDCILNIRMKLCEHILNVSMHEFDDKSSGVFMERIKNDPNDIINIFNDMQDYLLEIITDFGILFFVYYINFYFGIFYTISIVALFIIQKERIVVLLNRTKEWKIIQEENSGVLNEFIRGIRDIKSLGLDNTFLKHIFKTFEKNHNKKVEMDYQTYWYNFLYFTVRALVIFIILIAGVIFIYQGKITAASLIIVYMYRDKIFNFVLNASKFIEAIGKFDVSATRILELMEGKDFSHDHYGTTKVKNLKGNIIFNNVKFGYTKKLVLKNINFEIDENEVVAIVGKSGSGKSTIFNVLTKLYPIDNNRITIGGYDLNTLSKETLRSNIALITQNPYVFKMSIKDNLRLVNPKLKEEEMIKICKKVCIHDYIMSLPNKYDTILGEAGGTLSGGQKQRLAIARALIKKSNIILFDEATSALDNETQENIKKTIENISENCTVIIIAHRLSTIKSADKIIVLDKGKIDSIGNHRSLLKNSQIYKNLYKNEGK